jgi:hypothetical protein
VEHATGRQLLRRPRRSAILGRGANKLLIDDPFGDAESEVIREKVWKWYAGSIYNRLQPGAAIVLIGHRMHED